MRSNLFKNT